jgi:hypothetical protein
VVTADAAEAARKAAGYGLPCAKCRTYYSAEVKVCPVCKSSERVAVSEGRLLSTSPVNEQSPDPALLEQERERFLCDFKAQLANFEVPGQAAVFSRCIKEENHQGEFTSAAVCQSCYERVRERVDAMEAALHMDLKEAAQIVYDAVWADPSDSNKTYENAANALLSELRKRSCVSHNCVLPSPTED